MSPKQTTGVGARWTERLHIEPVSISLMLDLDHGMLLARPQQSRTLPCTFGARPTSVRTRHCMNSIGCPQALPPAL